ncbi:hypothetical protein HDK77DRAFT_1853 [Phyllosticta capitalensis]
MTYFGAVVCTTFHSTLGASGSHRNLTSSTRPQWPSRWSFPPPSDPDAPGRRLCRLLVVDDDKTGERVRARGPQCVKDGGLLFADGLPKVKGLAPGSLLDPGTQRRTGSCQKGQKRRHPGQQPKTPSGETEPTTASTSGPPDEALPLLRLRSPHPRGNFSRRWASINVPCPPLPCHVRDGQDFPSVPPSPPPAQSHPPHGVLSIAIFDWSAVPYSYYYSSRQSTCRFGQEPGLQKKHGFEPLSPIVAANLDSRDPCCAWRLLEISNDWTTGRCRCLQRIRTWQRASPFDFCSG